VTDFPSTTRERNVWLQIGKLLDGTCTSPSNDAHVVYNGAGIVFVGAGGRLPPRELIRDGQEKPDVDAPDFTMLPGLIEAHAHLFLEGGELDLAKRASYIKQSPAELLAAARERLAKLVRLGLAGVRDAGDRDGVGLALSKLCANPGRPLMPFVESPGAAIYHQGRYGGFMADPLENYPSPRDCVEARIHAGADRIKLIPTGIINFKKGLVTSEPQMTTDEIVQLVVAAKSFGRQTFAHASGATGIDRVIDGGVDSIEHGFFIRDEQLARICEQRAAWVPTFAPVQKQVDHANLMGWDAEVVANLRRILEGHASSLVKAHKMGAVIVAGSDAGSVGVAHGLGLLYELELMERAGLPAIAVINAATGVGSDRFAYREKIGRIKAGYLSRFILTRHSPVETVSNLRRPKWVVFDGEALATGETIEDKGL
jgi:imidazolonepropionase-like amidohydrolase